jgi:transcriptional regulator with XRE-family HTH domain
MPVRTVIDPFALQIGARIRAVRHKQGLSLAAMEITSGVSKGHLSNIERGQVSMNVITLYKIARALKVPLMAILPPLARVMPGASIT